MSKVGDQPRGEIERGDIHGKHGVREVVKRPTEALAKRCELRIEVTARRHIQTCRHSGCVDWSCRSHFWASFNPARLTLHPAFKRANTYVDVARDATLDVRITA